MTHTHGELPLHLGVRPHPVGSINASTRSMACGSPDNAYYCQVADRLGDNRAALSVASSDGRRVRRALMSNPAE